MTADQLVMMWLDVERVSVKVFGLAFELTEKMSQANSQTIHLPSL